MNFGKPPFMQTLRGSDDQRSIFFGCCHVVPSEPGFHRHRLQRTDKSPFRTRWEHYRHIGREPTRGCEQFLCLLLYLYVRQKSEIRGIFVPTTRPRGQELLGDVPQDNEVRPSSRHRSCRLPRCCRRSLRLARYESRCRQSDG